MCEESCWRTKQMMMYKSPVAGSSVENADGSWVEPKITRELY